MNLPLSLSVSGLCARECRKEYQSRQNVPKPVHQEKNHLVFVLGSFFLLLLHISRSLLSPRLQANEDARAHTKHERAGESTFDYTSAGIATRQTVTSTSVGGKKVGEDQRDPFVQLLFSLRVRLDFFITAVRTCPPRYICF